MPHSHAAGGDMVWRPTRLALYARDGWLCSACDWEPDAAAELRVLTAALRRGTAVDHTHLGGARATRGLTLDHATPPSRGGPSGPAGLVCMCVWCNSSKKACTVREFAPRRARRIAAQLCRERDQALGRALCALLYPGWREAEASRSRRRRDRAPVESASEFFEAIAQGRRAA